MDCTTRGQGRRNVLTNSCFRVNSYANIVADRRGGAFADDLYLVLDDNRNGSRQSSNVDVFFFTSKDGGQTWIGPTRVNDDPSRAPDVTTEGGRDCGRVMGRVCPPTAPNFGNDQFFPWIDISDQGDLNVVFYDRRLDTNSTGGEWPESRAAPSGRPGNYLVWNFGGQCSITTTATVTQSSTSIPAGARQCLGNEAAIVPQPTGAAFGRPLAVRLGRVATESQRRLWGGETVKAVENFPVSGQPIPAPVARWLGRIKAAAARVNAELGLLDSDKSERIAAAADRVAAGELDDQFPIDVFQTGSGTSSNMNANEVIATLAGEDVHANDDVNMGQSSNDVFPTAVHLAALDEITHDLLPALGRLAEALAAKAVEFDDVVKSGRTHWMDAVPVTLGQEFAGYAAQAREGAARVRDALPRLGKVPLGGTATGTGLNTHPEFASRVRARLQEETGLEISPPADPFEAQAARDAIAEASGALKVLAVSLTKIANDLRFMGSGPRAGLAEIVLPELQKGSSIMPGKVNPVIPEVVTQVAAQVIGNDQAIAVGGLQGHFELNVFVPLLARNLLDSVKLLASASRLFAERCVEGIEANRETCERYAELTLSAATALNPYIGYDKGAEIVKEAASSGRSLREVAREAGVDEAVLEEALDYRKMAKPHEQRPR
jgi:fumarate hydratase class II